MGEPTLEPRSEAERTSNGSASTQHFAEQAKPWRGESDQKLSRGQQGLKVQAKGMSFADGERLLAPVQRKPDPAAQDPAPNGDADAKGTAGRDEVLVIGAVRKSLLAMRNARLATARIEGLIEAMLVDDQQSDAATTKVGDATKRYTDAQKPDLLQGLELILNFASMARSAVGLLRRVPVSGLASAPGFIAAPSSPRLRAPAPGAALDAAADTVSVAKGVDDGSSKLDAALHGDEVVGMVASVTQYTDAVRSSVETLNNYALGKEQSEIGSHIELALVEQTIAWNLVGTMRGGVSPGTNKQLLELEVEINASVDSVASGIDRVRTLVAARQPGAELAKGTRGRSVFDLVASSPDGFSLHVEQMLEVDVDTRGGYQTSEVPIGYWLHAGQPDLLMRLDTLLGSASDAPVREMYAQFGKPGFAVESMRRVTAAIGLPIGTLVPPALHAFETVSVSGEDGKVSIPRAEWESNDGRDRAIWRVAQSNMYGQP